MEAIYSNDYKALKYYSKNTRAEILVEKQRGTYNIKEETENRLFNLGCISWKENNKLYHKNFILTLSGEEFYLKLKRISHTNINYTYWIIGIILGLIYIYSLGKNLGWW